MLCTSIKKYQKGHTLNIIEIRPFYISYSLFFILHFIGLPAISLLSSQQNHARPFSAIVPPAER